METEEYSYGENDRINQNDGDSDGTYFSRHDKSAIGTRLGSGTNISANKAAKLCKQSPEESIDIPSPSQQGICKELFKTSDEMEKHLTNSLCNQKWILCFDGHHIDRTEYQVVVIKNKTSEMKLAALKPCDGEAETITEGLISVLLGRISLVTFNLKDYR